MGSAVASAVLPSHALTAGRGRSSRPCACCRERGRPEGPGDGALDRQELRAILEASLAEQSVAVADDVLKNMASRLLARADLDKDGRISRDDFVKTLADHPGIEEQFSVYAADWLNEGKGFRRPRVRAAPLRLRLKRFWQKRRRGWLWALLYVAANAALFLLAMEWYATQGAELGLQIARGAGACLNLNGALVLLPMCRSLWTRTVIATSGTP